MELVGIHKIGVPEYHFKFNGVENETCCGLNWNETRFRTHDLQVGRWGQIHPETEFLKFQSPYVGFNNSPTMITDPEGDLGWIGAIVGGAVGFVYGAVKYGFKKGNWKRVIATTVGGAVAGATLNAGLGAATTAGLTGANMAFAFGASSIASGITGNLAEQGVNMLLGAQKKFNEQDFIASLIVSVPAGIVGAGFGEGGKRALNHVTKKLEGTLIKKTSFQTRKQFMKEQTKALRKQARQKGQPINSKQAKQAAEKMFDRIRKDKLEKGTKMWIDFTSKGVKIGTATSGKIATDRLKVGQKKKEKK